MIGEFDADERKLDGIFKGKLGKFDLNDSSIFEENEKLSKIGAE